MAITRVGSQTGTTTVTIPTHQIGDLILICAYRDGSNTAPALPAGFVNINNAGANTNSMRAGWKIATTTSETSGTWTNATHSICLVYRNASIAYSGGFANGGNSNTTFSYTGFTLTSTLPWIVGFVGHVDGTGVAAVGTAPTGMTNITVATNATARMGAHDTNGTVGSWSTQTVATGIAAAAWRSLCIELVDETPGANIAGYTQLGASANNISDVNACQVTPSVSGTISSIRIPVRHNFSPSIEQIRVAVYTDSSTVPVNLVESASSSFVPVDGGIRIARFTTFSGTINVTAGVPFWIAVWSDFNAVQSYFYDAGATNQVQQQVAGLSAAFTWPNPFSVDATGNIKMTVWAEITPTPVSGIKKLALLGVG